MKWRTAGALAALVLLGSSAANAIGIRIAATSGGTLEDAILIASVGGAAPRNVIPLGDLNLSSTNFVYNVPVDAGETTWWLIGHEGSSVVYSSVRNLAGVDLYSTEPYTGASGVWNIPANLDGYVNSTAYSLDWWAQTVNNHSSHVALDGAQAGLWSFASPGVAAGTVAVNLHSNTVPDGNGNNHVSDGGATLGLLALAIAALVAVRRRAT